MKLISEEFGEKQYAIALSESELGTILVSIGNITDTETKEIRDSQYSPSLKLVEDNFTLYKQIKKILGLEIV